jgi:hypothetical protein
MADLFSGSSTPYDKIKSAFGDNKFLGDDEYIGTGSDEQDLSNWQSPDGFKIEKKDSDAPIPSAGTDSEYTPYQEKPKTGNQNLISAIAQRVSSDLSKEFEHISDINDVNLAFDYADRVEQTVDSFLKNNPDIAQNVEDTESLYSASYDLLKGKLNTFKVNKEVDTILFQKFGIDTKSVRNEILSRNKELETFDTELSTSINDDITKYKEQIENQLESNTKNNVYKSQEELQNDIDRKTRLLEQYAETKQKEYASKRLVLEKNLLEKYPWANPDSVKEIRDTYEQVGKDIKYNEQKLLKERYEDTDFFSQLALNAYGATTNMLVGTSNIPLFLGNFYNGLNYENKIAQEQIAQATGATDDNELIDKVSDPKWYGAMIGQLIPFAAAIGGASLAFGGAGRAALAKIGMDLGPSTAAKMAAGEMFSLPIESFVEGGMAYSEMIQDGKTHDEAANAAYQTTMLNLAWALPQFVSQVLIFKEGLNKIASNPYLLFGLQAAADAPEEAAQEIYQGYASEKSKHNAVGEHYSILDHVLTPVRDFYTGGVKLDENGKEIKELNPQIVDEGLMGLISGGAFGGFSYATDLISGDIDPSTWITDLKFSDPKKANSVNSLVKKLRVGDILANLEANGLSKKQMLDAVYLMAFNTDKKKNILSKEDASSLMKYINHDMSIDNLFEKYKDNKLFLDSGLDDDEAGKNDYDSEVRNFYESPDIAEIEKISKELLYSISNNTENDTKIAADSTKWYTKIGKLLNKVTKPKSKESTYDKVYGKFLSDKTTSFLGDNFIPAITSNDTTQLSRIVELLLLHNKPVLIQSLLDKLAEEDANKYQFVSGIINNVTKELDSANKEWSTETKRAQLISPIVRISLLKNIIDDIDSHSLRIKNELGRLDSIASDLKQLPENIYTQFLESLEERKRAYNERLGSNVETIIALQEQLDNALKELPDFKEKVPVATSQAIETAIDNNVATNTEAIETVSNTIATDIDNTNKAPVFSASPNQTRLDNETELAAEALQTEIDSPTGVEAQQVQGQPDALAVESTTKALEDKKTDIERRRQEELTPIERGLSNYTQFGLLQAVNNKIATTGNAALGFKNTEIELTNEELDEVNKTFKAYNKNLLTAQEFNEWRKEFSNKVLSRVQKEINAKYDAELKAVETETEIPLEVSEEGVQVARKKPIRKNKKTKSVVATIPLDITDIQNSTPVNGEVISSSVDNIEEQLDPFEPQKKNTSPENSIAYLDQQYEVDTKGNKKSISLEANSLYIKLLDPDFMPVGTEVVLKFISKSEFVPYYDSNNKLISYKEAEANNEVPIGIYKGTTLVGYVHLPSWVNLSNVPRSVDIPTAIENLNKLRDKVIKEGEVKTTIIEVTSNVLATTLDGENGKYELNKTSDNVPDTNIKIAIGDSGQLVYGEQKQNIITETKNITTPNVIHNAIPYIVVDIPMNETKAALPLILPTIGELSSLNVVDNNGSSFTSEDIINTVVELLTYVNFPTNEDGAIDFGIDKDKDSVIKFVSNFFMTENLTNESSILEKVEANSKQQFRLRAPLKVDGNSKYYVGFATFKDKNNNKFLALQYIVGNEDTVDNRNKHIGARKQAVPEKLTVEEYKKQLRLILSNVLPNLSPNVSIPLLNSKAPYIFTVVKDGSLVQLKFNSYNEYVKNITKTFLAPVDLGNGKYSYIRQPVYRFDMDSNKKEKGSSVNEKIEESNNGIVSSESTNNISDKYNKLFGNDFIDNLPSVDDNIKLGVQELFDSNPELANQVDEALGFKQNNIEAANRIKKAEQDLKKIHQIGIADTIEEVEKAEGKKIIVLDTNDFKNKTQKSVAFDRIFIPEQYRKQGLGLSLYIIRGEELLKEGKHLVNYDQLSDDALQIWKRLLDLGLATQSGEYGTYQYIGLQNQLTSEQKKQALQLYSKYLDTIFPNSKVKDIVYHGTSFGKFDKFSKDELGKNTEAPSSLQGFFFSNNKATAGSYAQKTEKDWGEISLEESIERYEDNKDNNELYYELVKKSDYIDKRNPFGEGSVFIKSRNKELYFGEFEDFTEEHEKALEDLNIIEKKAELLKKQNSKLQLFTVVLNIKNPKVEDKKGKSGNINQIIKSVKTINDGVILNNYKDPFISDVYVVFEPEQIHILGSKQDIEGFKEFVEKDAKNSELFYQLGGESGIELNLISSLNLSNIDYLPTTSNLKLNTINLVTEKDILKNINFCKNK